MEMQHAGVTELLDVARDLVEHARFDVAVALALLDTLPIDGLDVQTCGAIRHAKRTVMLACCGGSMQSTVARYALFRVIVLVEETVVGRVSDHEGLNGALSPSRQA